MSSLQAFTVLALTLVPDVAAACVTCIDSAYGNRTFNWAFAGLMLAPFAVAIGIVGGIAWIRRRHRASPDDPTGHDGLDNPTADVAGRRR